MGTRGAFGFYLNGKTKVGYNHFDSYPEGLGNDVLRFLKEKTIDELNEIGKFVFAHEDEKKFQDVWGDDGFNPNFSDNTEFLKDSLFCEWAYIINLDDNLLEVYKGFNKSCGGAGRYAMYTLDEDKKYFGVTLLGSFDLQDCIDGKLHFKDDKVVAKSN